MFYLIPTEDCAKRSSCFPNIHYFLKAVINSNCRLWMLVKHLPAVWIDDVHTALRALTRIVDEIVDVMIVKGISNLTINLEFGSDRYR